LKDLGVSLVGHRRRLLDAIATLDAQSPAAVTAAPHYARPSAYAERRQLTVMFFRPGWLDRALRRARPRGFARGHFSVSRRRCWRRRWVRWLRREVHGRRRAGLFWLPAGA